MTTAVIVALSSTVGSVPEVRGAEPNAGAAAAHLAHQHGGTADDYRLVHERAATVPGTSEALWAAKLEGTDGTLHTVYRDPTGRFGDGAHLRSRELAATELETPFVAKADAELEARVARARPTESVPVTVWLDVDLAGARASVVAAHPEIEWVAGRPTVTSLDQARALRAELWATRRAVIVAAADRLRAEATALGASVAYASDSAPIVFLDVPAGRAERLADLPLVSSMGLERTWTPMMSTAGPTVDANWTTGGEDQGAGVRVAVVEYHNVRNSGDLAGRVVASHSSSGTLAYSSGSQFDHPTWVAGAIAGGGVSPGTAPGARIVSASTGGGGAGLARDRAVIATTDWAISPSGGDSDVVNVSLVQDTSTGAEEARRYFDSVVDEGLRVVVAAAGNYSALGTWRIGSPGTGWNVLTVGGTDDRNTAGRADDRMWYVPGSNGSCYVDPPGTAWNSHGDFNKPNVSAPAVGVRTANGLAASGTSVATPIVSGVVAQLIARAPILTSWPESVRAIVMAGAVHQTRMPDDSRNPDVEGVGSVSALWSNRILNAGDGTHGGYLHGSMTGTASHAIQVLGGQRVKLALTWNSRTTGSSNLGKTDALASDLDLRVRLPNGVVVGSYSFDNSYETVDIVSPITGTLTIEVVGSRIAAGGERYAVAWTKIGGDGAPPRVTLRSPEAGEPWAAASVDPTITFNEPVTGITYDSVRLTPSGGGAAIPVDLRYQSTAKRIVVSPRDPLAPGTYVLSLSDYLRDHAWNRLAPLSWSFVVVPSPPGESATLNPARRAAFAAGTHTGYRFGSDGSPTASRTSSLGSASGARVDWRGRIPGQPGVWLRVVDGGWAGYYVRESAAVAVPGTIEHRDLAPGTRMTFGAGEHTGYRFASDGSVAGRLTRSISRASGAEASGRAVINGRWHLLVVDGVWAGYWVPETARSFLPGALDHRDMTAGRVRFGTGTHQGYRFDAAGTPIGTRVGTLDGASSAPAIAWAIVNGAPRFLIGAGMLSGHWASESSSVRRP